MAPKQSRPVTLFPRNTDDGGRSSISTNPNELPPNMPSSDEPALKERESKIKRVAHQKFLRPFNLPEAAQIKEEPQRLVCRLDDPSKHYRPFQKRELGGQAIISYGESSKCKLVAIKKHASKPTDSCIHRLKEVSHGNIVKLYEVFLYQGSLFSIYEYDYFEVTLSEVNSVPVMLEEHHIAVICHEVLKGISYLQRALQIVHGHLDTDNVILSVAGNIRIANIAESMMIEENEASMTDTRDTQALGRLAMRLMELGTSIQNPGTLVLRRPEVWSPEAQSFLKNTEFVTSEELLKSRFLKNSPSSQCLYPHIHTAIMAKERPWELCNEIDTTH